MSVVPLDLTVGPFNRWPLDQTRDPCGLTGGPLSLLGGPFNRGPLGLAHCSFGMIGAHWGK